MSLPLPELLAPAGSMDALCAAIDAGADAVYFGGKDFGARAFAKNFTHEEIAEAAALCRAYGVCSYVTLNTLIFDREMPQVLREAAFLENAGVDALIVADVGAARLIAEKIPTMQLHASTQFSGHNSDAARFLAAHGFSRMVTARECSYEDLKALCAASPIEIEVFIHGALCVCHSGQCLFSSVVGGRSGNRGMCAQPCRLPDAKGNYPLSLKDLSLASRMDRLLDCGAASLKIEGRMKSPTYVHGVTEIYRRLLDERRNANPDEEARLAELFSRSGFTTGYFDRKITSSMLGVRRQEDKDAALSAPQYDGLRRKLPVSVSATFKAGIPFTVTLEGSKGRVSAAGEIPQIAKNAPLDRAALEKNLLKFGGTPYEPLPPRIEMDGGLMLPLSQINATRRAATRAYAALGEREHTVSTDFTPVRRQKEDAAARTAVVFRAKNLPRDERFYDFFDLIFLPLSEYGKAAPHKKLGVLLPAVILESEREKIAATLAAAYARGARAALCAGYGQIELARSLGFAVHGDFRLNITNQPAADFALANGFEGVILSPELTYPRLSAIGGRVRAIVYGRLPLMLLEKCVASETASCEVCGKDGAALADRRSARFPILREEPHRNLLFNSVPTYAADKLPQGGQHYIFTTESEKEILRVLDAYTRGEPPFFREFRRIKDRD